jgi:hypothetical protein
MAQIDCRRRCALAVGNPIMRAYHDDEWGRAQADTTGSIALARRLRSEVNGPNPRDGQRAAAVAFVCDCTML